MVVERDLAVALEAARRGEDWGVSLLFRAIQPQLLRYLGQNGPQVAQDLASETWLSVAQDLSSFEGSVSDFRALLFTIARRRLVDHYRREQRRPQQAPLDDGREFASQGSVEAEAELLSAGEAIAALVSSLPKGQSEVILLRIVGDLSVEEVARVMGRSTGAIRVLQHRALRRLEKKFQADGVTI
ncbi:MAG: RNA polymerase sigma factor [Acidimicrobiales bacterium]